MTETIIRDETATAAEPSAASNRQPLIGAAGLRRVGLVALVMFAVTVGVGFVLTDVLASGPMGEADRDVSRWFEGWRTGTWNELTDWGSSFSDTITIVILLAVLVPALYFVTKRWNASLLLLGAVGLETLVFVTAGFVVGRERPPVEQLDVSPPTASFPSGHTGAAVAFYIGLVILIFWWTTNRAARVGAVVLFGAVPIIVAISRLYRGMHYTTDVVFGALVGAASVALFASVLKPSSRREPV